MKHRCLEKDIVSRYDFQYEFSYDLDNDIYWLTFVHEGEEFYTKIKGVRDFEDLQDAFTLAEEDLYRNYKILRTPLYKIINKSIN